MPNANLTLQELFSKYLDETISPAELRELYRLVDATQKLDQLDSLLEASFADHHYPETSQAERQEILTGLLSRIDADQESRHMKSGDIVFGQSEDVSYGQRRVPIRRIGRFAAYAAALILVSMGGWLMWHKQEAAPAAPMAVQRSALRDIPPPSGARATLTLAGGQRIVLDSAGSGPLAMQGRTRINKLPDGQVAYHAASSDDVLLYNTLSTTRGGQSMIMLPDGTKVWLNALSSLRFPAAFGRERTVELDGEAYFEVQTDKSKPFIVKLHDQSEIQVLGTHFNVNAYSDEPTYNTTLLEGAVKINSRKSAASVTIIPGQQAQSGPTRLVVDDKVNIDNVMAWKNGYFSFDGNTMEMIMRQVSRWYGVNIVYEGDVRAERFAGYLPRTVSVSRLLEVLSLTKTVQFTIHDQTITVKPFHP